MKLILSRKGFDSAAGGFPSPIFENGTILSLPIPAGQMAADYDITYEKLNPLGYDIAKLIDDISINNHKADRVTRSAIVHLDPDVCHSSIQPRHEEWKGLFGQCGSAQGHLRGQQIGKGDIFLFFGLFRRVISEQGHYRFAPGSRPMHLIWGWMQVEDIVEVNTATRNQYPWAAYHPHFYMDSAINNTLYIASKHLCLNGEQVANTMGYGALERYNQLQQLSDPDSHKLTDWRLPSWMYKENQPCPLTYNGIRPWSLQDGYACLSTYPRGQEYVMDCQDYPQATDWIKSIVTGS